MDAGTGVTLYLTPVVYICTYMTALQAWTQRRKKSPVHEPARV
ncbi:MAG: hypothetical protein ACKV22_31320 [Bryobacteraceae bacterium]